MFASKSERKVHYSIRKFSIGVASVVVASLFLGGVVHAEGVRIGNNSTVTSSGQDISKKYADEVKSHLESILSEIRTNLDRSKHTKTVNLINKLQDIKRTYLYELNVLEEKSKAELPSKTKETKEKLTAAFEQFKKDTLPTEPGKKVAEAKKKVEEAEKKAKDQKEEDRRNYPTITYKTLELEIAESDVEVKKAELELVKVKANEPRDEEKIKQAEAEVESKQAEATRLKKIKTDREEAKRKADAKLKEAVEKNVATSEQDEPKKRTKRGALGEPATPDKKENDAKSSDSSVGEETLPSPSLKPGKKVAEAEKKVEEAEKKAKDQKEEDRRNYPTNTYKTLDLEIAESDVKVKEAELELVKEEAKEPRDEEKIKQAEAEVESKQAEATRLEKIKTDRKKAEEEAKRKAAEEDKVKEKPAEQPQPAPAPQPEKPTEEPENPAPAPKPEKPAEQPKAEKTDDQQAEEDYARRSEEEYNRLTQQQPPKIEKPAPAPQPEQPAPAPKTGWKQENGMWYFYNTDGSMA
ncbi:pneumococcal surface protein PspC, choline-binding form, partial [Streptococcus pneumoniae]|uniref:pneumococcal surface protein PspC, choline-binding form n=1 Tax=Streptococcus pneumoniae TaxID=1313 RepID=UPI000B594753